MPVEAVEAVEAVVPAEAAAFEEEWAPKACAVPTGRGSVQLPLLEPAGPLMAPPGDREGAHGGVGGAARGIAASVRRPRAAREGSQPLDQRTTCVRPFASRDPFPPRQSSHIVPLLSHCEWVPSRAASPSQDVGHVHVSRSR